MDLTKIVIVTGRLRLMHTFHDYDNENFKEFTKKVTRYMNWEPFDTLEDLEKSIDARYEKIIAGEMIRLTTLNKETGEFLGIGTITDIKTSTPELGIWIKQSAHGHHYGKEAVQGLKEWAEKYLEYDYLKYPFDKNNISSKKIAEALGGVYGASYPVKIDSGKILDVIEYRMYKK